MRQLLLLSCLVIACGSSSSDDESDAGACPSLQGTWTVTAHCDGSLIGMQAVISEDACSFGPPFEGFSGTVSEDGTVTVSGPQSCTGSLVANAISLTCTPGTCLVTLSR